MSCVKGWNIYLSEDKQFWCPDFDKEFPSGNRYSVKYVSRSDTGFCIFVHKNLYLIRNFTPLPMSDKESYEALIIRTLFNEMVTIEKEEGDIK